MFNEYIEAGLHLIPLRKRSGAATDKAPLERGWRTATYTNAEIIKLFQEGHNIGVRLTSDWIVIDVDPRNAENGTPLTQLEILIGEPLSPEIYPTAITGGGGFHIWMRNPNPRAPVRRSLGLKGIEIKSEGQQVVACGSTHPSGRPYVWMPNTKKLASAPAMPPALALVLTRTDSSNANSGAASLTNSALKEALSYLPVTQYREHNAWFRLMCASHHATGGAGCEAFVEWSTSDPLYAADAQKIRARWETLSVVKERIVSASHLEYEVTKHGGTLNQVNEVLMLNQQYAACLVGGKFRILKLAPNGRGILEKLTKEDFENFLKPKKTSTGRQLATLWLGHPERRTYSGVVFDPAGPPVTGDGKLNLWRGWAVEPTPGDWSLFKKLIDTLVGHDERAASYVIKWLAFLVQKPAHRPEVALVFRGEKGTGKSSFGRLICELVGGPPHGLQISASEHLTGRFNAHLQECLVLFSDEAYWAGDKAGEGQFKRLLTEPTLVYEGKGQNAIIGANHTHLILASNAEWVVPAGMDGERRFAVFDVSTALQKDCAFFHALHLQMRDGGLAAMLHDLLSCPLGNWHPRNDIPETIALMEQRLHTAEPLARWWLEKLNLGALPWGDDDWRTSEVIVPKEVLRADYANSAPQNARYALVSFSMKLKKYCPFEAVQTRLSNAQRLGLAIATDARGRVPAFKFPQLEVCRAFFAQKLGPVHQVHQGIMELN